MADAAIPAANAACNPAFTTLHHVQNLEAMMAWKAPKIVEVAVGMEINMYACAVSK